MAARKPIVCGLSAGGIIPPLPRVNTDDGVEDIPPTEAELVEISDDEEEDLVELSSDEYRRNMGYLIRVEEEADDIPPEFREGERGEVQGVEGGNQARRGTILYVSSFVERFYLILMQIHACSCWVGELVGRGRSGLCAVVVGYLGSGAGEVRRSRLVLNISCYTALKVLSWAKLFFGIAVFLYLLDWWLVFSRSSFVTTLWCGWSSQVTQWYSIKLVSPSMIRLWSLVVSLSLSF
ncbi:LOW QUALITY PROTEIN: hypothetical protein YC2023_075131 [Brassica napus]